jgi:hypothetical protein
MDRKINSRKSVGLGKQVPPALAHVLIFFDQAGFTETEAKHFYNHYEEMDWRGIKGGLIRNWKTKAQEWLWEIKLRNPHLRMK